MASWSTLASMTDGAPSGRKRDVQVTLWISQAGAEALDEARGTWTRNEYVRKALDEAIKHKLLGPKPGRF